MRMKNKDCIYLWRSDKMCILLIVSLFLSSVFSVVQANDNKEKENTTFPANVSNDRKKEINGSIYDGNNQPVIGANVIEVNTDNSNGTVTDASGRFNLIVNENAVIRISYIGCLSQEVNTKGKTNFIIIMQEDTKALDEVVVVGYGTMKKSDLTGAVGTVKADALKPIPLNRVAQALQGLVPGLDIQNVSGAPEGIVSMRIRGISSIGGGSDPLVVIDGVQGVSMADVNPQDVKSIEVLKDASATAVYGSRGASGVILITTHKGGTGKPTLSYDGFVKVSQIRNKLDLVNGLEYMATSDSDIFTEEEIAYNEATGGTDWQDEIFQTSVSQNHYLNIAGGNDDITYNISGNYAKNNGIIINSWSEQFIIKPNLSVNLTKKLNVSLDMVFSKRGTRPDPGDRESAAADNVSVVFNAWLYPPCWPVYMADGGYSVPHANLGSSVVYNPVAVATEQIIDQTNYRTILSPTIKYQIIPGLTAQISGSYHLSLSSDKRYRNEKINRGISYDRSASIQNDTYSFFQNTNLIWYEKTFNNVHGFGVTALYETQKAVYNGDYAASRDFPTNSVTYNSLALGAAPQRPSSYEVSTALQSYMGRINYSYAGKYLLTLTGRYDGSSVFGANNKWGLFPSVALGWNVKNERFLEDSKVISGLKLRLSYGKVGNQAISPYQSLSKFETSTYALNTTSASTVVRLSSAAPNPDLKWETTKQSNIGVDMGFLNNRLNITADLYKKTTDDLLLTRPVPAASGFITKLENIGAVENKGIELLIQATPFDKKFKWVTSITYAKNKNKVLRLMDDLSEINLGGTNTPGTENTLWLVVGKPMGIVRTLEFAGTWKSWEAGEAAKYGAVPGQNRYVDQNGDYQLDYDNDVKDLGFTQPDFTFGFNNTFSYANFDLNVLIQGVQGNDIYYVARLYVDRNLRSRRLNYWSPENETDIQKPGIYNFNPLTSSEYIEDGSYIRVKNISLAYTLPKPFSNKLGVNSIQISFAGTNLFTFTKYSGYDPESSSMGVDAYGGIDFGIYPSQKSFTVGLNVGF